MLKRLYENPQIGERIYFKKYAHEPGEQVTIIDAELNPGASTPLHYHRTYDEHFECMEGELSLEIDRKITVLRAGDQVTAPRRSVHRFFNQGAESVLFRTTVSPGHAGYEQMLKIVHGLAVDGLTDAKGLPRKFWHLGILVALSETNLPGWLSLLQPLLLRSARRALADGRYARELLPYTK